MHGDDDFIILTGLLVRLAYELHDNKFIGDELKEDLLEFWRMFNSYESELEHIEEKQGLRKLFENLQIKNS